MSPPLPDALQQMAPLLDRYGYGVVAVFAFVEGFGIPAPAVTALVAAAAYAASGHLALPGVVAVAGVAAAVGDNVGYGIGRSAGMPALRRWGRYLRLTTSRLQRAERYLTQRSAIIIPLARFIDGFRQTNGLIAGALGVPWRRYLPLDALGAVLWVSVWAGLGYTAGGHITAVYGVMRRYERWVVAAAVVAVVAAVTARIVRRRDALRRREPPSGR